MEWTTVTVIIALVGLGVTVIKPIISLTQSITKLTVLVDALEENMESWSKKNSESHARIWEHNDQQDVRIEDHEKRITVIEHR